MGRPATYHPYMTKTSHEIGCHGWLRVMLRSISDSHVFHRQASYLAYPGNQISLGDFWIRCAELAFGGAELAGVGARVVPGDWVGRLKLFGNCSSSLTRHPKIREHPALPLCARCVIACSLHNQYVPDISLVESMKRAVSRAHLNIGFYCVWWRANTTEGPKRDSRRRESYGRRGIARYKRGSLHREFDPHFVVSLERFYVKQGRDKHCGARLVLSFFMVLSLGEMNVCLGMLRQSASNAPMIQPFYYTCSGSH